MHGGMRRRQGSLCHDVLPRGIMPVGDLGRDVQAQDLQQAQMVRSDSGGQHQSTALYRDTRRSSEHLHIIRKPGAGRTGSFSRSQLKRAGKQNTSASLCTSSSTATGPTSLLFGWGKRGTSMHPRTSQDLATSARRQAPGSSAWMSA